MDSDGDADRLCKHSNLVITAEILFKQWQSDVQHREECGKHNVSAWDYIYAKRDMIGKPICDIQSNTTKTETKTMNELFTEIPESKPNRLRAARIALDKAQEHYDSLRDARDNYDAQTAETKWEIGEAAHKLQDAEEELKAAEMEAL